MRIVSTILAGITPRHLREARLFVSHTLTVTGGVFCATTFALTAAVLVLALNKRDGTDTDAMYTMAGGLVSGWTLLLLSLAILSVMNVLLRPMGRAAQ